MSYRTKTKLLSVISPDRLSYGTLGGLLATFFIGAFLRLYQLGHQILAEDEWHAIDVALHAGYRQIFSDFGGGGHSIPMALYNKLLLDTTGLSEFAIYAPFVFFGIVTTLILPTSGPQIHWGPQHGIILLIAMFVAITYILQSIRKTLWTNRFIRIYGNLFFLFMDVRRPLAYLFFPICLVCYVDRLSSCRCLPLCFSEPSYIIQ